jgi:hypothetical protein
MDLYVKMAVYVFFSFLEKEAVVKLPTPNHRFHCNLVHFAFVLPRGRTKHH